MMTTIGKGLAFVNLLLGMAMLAWAVSLYSQRPAYLDAKPESISAGQSPVIIAQLKEDIDNLGRAATAASNTWGVSRKALEDIEELRANRQKGYNDRLTWARTGHPTDKSGAGFFEPAYMSDAGSGASSGLLDLKAPGTPIKGPDNLPLRGVGTLGKQYAADVAEVIKRSKEIDGYRDQFQTLGNDILATDSRLLKMVTIRDSVQAELFHLATVQFNVYETRETVLRRKKQLDGRLDGLPKN